MRLVTTRKSSPTLRTPRVCQRSQTFEKVNKILNQTSETVVKVNIENPIPNETLTNKHN